ncbi:MAG TPA: endonuclease/exonuclease/phosphatase family protein [Streptosporangiaceae bacterium]|nr:endonuclease/exonuclease/phosphatase family protein [Streptosporangiaceae bacterium]
MPCDPAGTGERHPPGADIPAGRLWRRSALRIFLLWAPVLVYQAASGPLGLVRGASPLGSLLLAACLCVAAFLTCHLLANGRWWLWLLPTLAPPLLFAAVPAALLAAALLAAALGAGGPAPGRSLALAGAALVVAMPESGLRAGFLRRRSAPGAAADAVRIVSWNTYYWHQHDDPERFYAYLRGLDADVYLLQEYIYHVGNWRFRPLDDDARLFARFPDYQVAVHGQLVTMSRLPVEGTPTALAAEVLRVDLRLAPGGTVLSTYNLHIPVQLGPFSPFSRLFYRVVRERARERDEQYGALVRDIAGNREAVIVAGDFNASPIVGDVHRLELAATDAIRASHSLYPVSWNCRRRLLKLWRLDWAFVSGGARVHRYEFVDPGGRSDHCVQRLLVTVDQPEPRPELRPASAR